MPSGPKKRKAARRRKQQKEEKEHRHGDNGNGSDVETGSDSIVDDDDLSSSAATTPTPRSQHHLPNEPPNLDLDLGHHQHHHHKHHQEEQRKEKQSDVEDWVRQSEFDVGTPPPQTPSLAREEADEEHNHFGGNQKHQSPPVQTIEELEPSAPAAAGPPTADPVDTAPAPAPAPAARIDDQKPAAAVDDHPAAAGPKSVTETTPTDGKSSAATADEHQKQVPERASGCCGVLDWLLGRTG